MNRNFCRVDAEGNITAYAPDAISLGGRMIYHAPDEDYAAWAASQVPPFLRLISEPPEEVGCTFTPTERGEERDGKVYRLYDRHPIPAPEPPVIRYSGWKMYKAIKAEGFGEAFDALMKNNIGVMIAFVRPQYFLSNDPDFTAMVTQMCAALHIDEAAKERILAASVDEEVR